MSIFIHAILFIVENVDISIPLKNREDIIITATNNINIMYQKIQTSKIEESQNIDKNTDIQENKEDPLTEKVLKENKVKIPKKKKSDISDESQKKLDIIMNMTNNICN